jgi:hypothetical protein
LEWIRWCSFGVGQSPFEFQKGAIGSQDAVVLALSILGRQLCPRRPCDGLRRWLGGVAVEISAPVFRRWQQKLAWTTAPFGGVTELTKVATIQNVRG